MIKRAGNRMEMANLENEWRLLHALRSPRFARPVDYRKDDDSGAWMSVAKAEAQPIDEWPDRSPRVLLEIAADALEGLNTLHRAGLVHGDVRPQNLLVRSTPAGCEAMWVDLEHAVPIDRLAAGFGYVGGWHAASLERGEPQSGRTDLAALGALLGEIAEDDAATVDARRAERACLREFLGELAPRGADRLELDAGLALERLHELCGVHGIQLATREPDAGPPLCIENRRARQSWDDSWPAWCRADMPVLVDCSGPAGCGKTSFLQSAAARAALEGHVTLDLLGVFDCDAPAGDLVPDWGEIENDLESRDGTLLLLLTPAQFESFRVGLPGLVRRRTIAVVERRGTADSGRVVPAGWQYEAFPFPPFTAREWLSWANGSF